MEAVGNGAWVDNHSVPRYAWQEDVNVDLGGRVPSCNGTTKILHAKGRQGCQGR